VPHEVLGVATWITAAMLRQENAISVIRPARAGASEISRPKPFRENTGSAGATYVLDEAAHRVSMSPARLSCDREMARSARRPDRLPRRVPLEIKASANVSAAGVRNRTVVWVNLLTKPSTRSVVDHSAATWKDPRSSACTCQRHVKVS
jgi:hypothetical protein